MKEKIKTLLLYSEGVPTRKNILKTSLIKGLFKKQNTFDFPDLFYKNKFFGKIDRMLKAAHFETLGYVNDWIDEFRRTPEFAIEECNILDLIQLYKTRYHIKEYDLIVILHAAIADCIDFLIARDHWFQDRRGKLAVYLSNEYEFMDKKFKFLRQAGVDFICTQLPPDTADWLYSDIPGPKVLFMPHGINSAIYYPNEKRERSVDIGFIGARYPLWIGDTIRQDFLDEMTERCADEGFSVDIRYKNVPRNEWANFLRNCHGILGAESGSLYLDKKGFLLEQARKFMNRNPGASLDELKQEVFLKSDIEYIAGKAISSRHFEPMGTKTCQLLLEGDYCDLIEPGNHYLSLKTDLSNFSEVLREFSDDERRCEIIDNAYRHVMNSHTYRHRIEKLIDAFMKS